MHGTAPVPIVRKKILRFSLAGAPGVGRSTIFKQLIAAAGANAAVPATPYQSTHVDHINDGPNRSFATGPRSCILEPAVCAPIDEATTAPAYELSIIVSDASNGFTLDTRRQVAMANAIGVRHLVFAVNKLDLLSWDRQRYEQIVGAFAHYTDNLSFASKLAIPLSALLGDNIAVPSANMAWYDGPSLLSYLERTEFDRDLRSGPLRLHVAAVSRPDPDHRRYHGTIASGQLRRGDTIQVAVSGVTSAIERLFVDEIDREEAGAGESVSLQLSSHIDVGRGEMLVHPGQRPHIADQFAAHIVSVSAERVLPGRDYMLRMGTKEVTASITAIKHRLDIEALRQEPARTLQRGEIGACTIATAAPLALDAPADVPSPGRFALFDRYTDRLISAGTINFVLRRGENVHLQPLAVSKATRASLKEQEPCILWFTGLSGAGKSTIGNLVEGQLVQRGFHTYLLDGDNVRHGLNKNLGFTAADRVENIRRVGEVAKLFVDAGLIVLCSFISPFRAERAAVRDLVGRTEFVEIFVRAPLAVCEQRDPKGLYAKSRAGELPNFTGIDSPYEEPENPDLVLDTTSAPATELARRVIAILEARELIGAATAKHGGLALTS